MSDRVAMLRGDTVYRVHWMPGSDVLVGVCHCGAERHSEDPVRLWDWLLAHPVGHEPPAAGSSPEVDRDPVGARG
ncbi:hypothetical protein IOD16_10100 [Saccharothrix sp. 6-C]|uniref:hypothetical protein n=1 Tax=Saccharothrix sp. 6-C TaxID=2781735 RepID=UPI0019174436|nr:hypothetical protein [Saccharothrix sp. 6-C]QQQ78758.1 hypothetical protein IOD16_10100 [Saccharothrix sp. 6-C]